MMVGAAPKALKIAWCTSLDWVRIFRPLKSSRELMGFLEVVSRKPMVIQLPTCMLDSAILPARYSPASPLMISRASS